MNKREHTAFYLSVSLLITVVVLNIWVRFFGTIPFTSMHQAANVVTSIISSARTDTALQNVSEQKRESVELTASVDNNTKLTTFHWQQLNNESKKARSYYLYCSRNPSTGFILVARIPDTQTSYTMATGLGTEYCRMRINTYENNNSSPTISRTDTITIQGPNSISF